MGKHDHSKEQEVKMKHGQPGRARSPSPSSSGSTSGDEVREAAAASALAALKKKFPDIKKQDLTGVMLEEAFELQGLTKGQREKQRRRLESLQSASGNAPSNTTKAGGKKIEVKMASTGDGETSVLA